MRAALDTNILAYAEGVGDETRGEIALDLLGSLPTDRIILPAQTLGELFRVLTGKAKRSPDASRQALLDWSDSYEVADSTFSAFQSAFDLCVDHHLQIWDALILSVAAENGCRILLSEDFHNGFVWRGVTVINPFSPHPHSLLSSLIPH